MNKPKLVYNQFGGTVGGPIIKDNLFDPPPIFKLIQQNSGADNREMYQVFNMGHRLEIFTDEGHADALIKAAQKFSIDARIVGRTEPSGKKELMLKKGTEEIVY